MELRTLNLADNKLSPKSALVLFTILQLKVYRLTEIDLSMNDFSDHYTELDMPITTMSNLALKIKNCLDHNRLTKLNLASCKLNFQILEAIGQGLKLNKSLKELSLRDNAINGNQIGKFVEPLSKNKRSGLQKLDLAMNFLKD